MAFKSKSMSAGTRRWLTQLDVLSAHVPAIRVDYKLRRSARFRLPRTASAITPCIWPSGAHKLLLSRPDPESRAKFRLETLSRGDAFRVRRGT
jgi:hypothetical protein